MLVLSRYIDEVIVANGNIIITVVDIRDGKVRLGFEAPADVPIFRRELLGPGWRPRPGTGTDGKPGGEGTV